MSLRVLVTGGAGFIGSHTCVRLLEEGYEVVVLDNLSNSSRISLDRVEALTGRSLRFIKGDLLDREALAEAFDSGIDAVIHFAALKAVGESNEIPLVYYRNNVSGTVALLEEMQRRGVGRLVFSSSATVYGEPDSSPVTESSPLRAQNPYGRTKLYMEELLRDVARSEPGWKIISLRYFNPVGAHESGQIGEDPRGTPNNLLPYVMQVAVGWRDKVSVFGDDYPTRDGTGVRDYIHVVDLAQGHIAALEGIDGIDGCREFNLGTGRGTTVLELIESARKASGHDIPYEIVGRREGDAAECWALPQLAEEELGFKTERDIDDICRDAWRWQKQNPRGFEPSEEAD